MSNNGKIFGCEQQQHIDFSFSSSQQDRDKITQKTYMKNPVPKNSGLRWGDVWTQMGFVRVLFTSCEKGFFFHQTVWLLRKSLNFFGRRLSVYPNSTGPWVHSILFRYHSGFCTINLMPLLQSPPSYGQTNLQRSSLPEDPIRRFFSFCSQEFYWLSFSIHFYLTNITFLSKSPPGSLVFCESPMSSWEFPWKAC